MDDSALIETQTQMNKEETHKLNALHNMNMKRIKKEDILWHNAEDEENTKMEEQTVSLLEEKESFNILNKERNEKKSESKSGSEKGKGSEQEKEMVKECESDMTKRKHISKKQKLSSNKNDHLEIEVFEKKNIKTNLHSDYADDLLKADKSTNGIRINTKINSLVRYQNERGNQEVSKSERMENSIGKKKVLSEEEKSRDFKINKKTEYKKEKQKEIITLKTKKIDGDNKKEHRNQSDSGRVGTIMYTISTEKNGYEKQKQNFNESESTSAPASTRRITKLVSSKIHHNYINNLNVNNGSTSIKGKKENDKEFSKQHILDVLSKRVRCLTTIEYTKEGEYSNPIKYRRINTIQSNNNSKNKNESNNCCIDGSSEQSVLLLLTRDFRVNDNWALIYAYEMAQKKKCRLLACTYIYRKEKYHSRHINIKLKILKEMENNMKKLNIPFHVLFIYMIDEFVEFVKFYNVKTIVCDFNPLRPYRNFLTNLAQIAMSKKIKMYQVDAHNIIPTWVTSNEEEMNARTMRMKIKSNLCLFLTDFIELMKFNQTISFPESFDINQAMRKLTIDTSCPVLYHFDCTENKALQMLKTFCETELEKYHLKKEDPNYHISHMLFHLISLGLISSQRCALQVSHHTSKKPSINSISGKEAFCDQVIIRKELADNFCYYNKNYDNTLGAKQWAKETLEKHESDKREHIYSYEELKDAKTHDDLWNCSQLQLVKEGMITGNLKIYWAKQILNWTTNFKKALLYAFELYKHYSMDGITPINYATIMNAILGIHDISCVERNVVGKIRHMSYDECKKRFNTEIYMSRFPEGIENANLIQKIPTITFANYLKKRKRNSNEIINEKKEKV